MTGSKKSKTSFAKKLSVLLLFGVAIAGIALVVIGAPKYFYLKIINNQYNGEWFETVTYKDIFVTPNKYIKYPTETYEKEALLWNTFHIGDVLIPMPTQHPKFNVLPLLSYKKRRTQIGLKVNDMSSTELVQVFFPRNFFLPNEINSQKIFQVPYVKKVIKTIKSSVLFKDLFERDLKNYASDIDTMIYSLYIFQMRMKIFPEKIISYKLLDDDTGIMKLDSSDKDYLLEYIVTRKAGHLFSYILRTRKNSEDSFKMRAMYLKDISFLERDVKLSRFYYKEFKSLKYVDKIDQVGMLHLFSAWTQDFNDKTYLVELISYLEKSLHNREQLESVFKYTNKRYGKTFSQTSPDVEDDEIELKLQIEKAQREIVKQERERHDFKPVRELTTQEKLDLKLKEVKNLKLKKEQVID